MHEVALMGAMIQNRTAFFDVLALIDASDFSDLGQILFQEIQKFYETDDATKSVDTELVLAQLKRKYPKRHDLFIEYICSIPQNVSVPNVLETLRQHLKERKAIAIIHALTSKDDTKANTLMEEYLELAEKSLQSVVECYNAVTAEELNIQLSADKMIPIYPSKLNTLIGGGLPRQSQMLVFARPNVGKSTMCTNLAYGVGTNGYKVAYFGNEDADARMLLRFLSRFSDMTKEEIHKNPQVAFERAMKNGYGNLFFIPMHPGSIAEVRKHVERIRPDLVIIDQIRNLPLVKDSITLSLEQAVMRMRNLAKEFDFVSVLVTQAGESAENRETLRMTDVEWSNTGVAAQMDLMIGIGQNKELRASHLGMLSFPKSKFTDVLDPMPVTFDYTKNKVLA